MPEITDEWLATRIRLVMEGREISIREAAVAIEIPYRTLQNQLAGKNKMPAATLAKLAMMLEVPIDFLINERLRLKPRALAIALDRTLGPFLPVAVANDQALTVELQKPPQPDNRSVEERFNDAKAMAFILRDEYEMFAVDVRDMRQFMTEAVEARAGEDNGSQ